MPIAATSLWRIIREKTAGGVMLLFTCLSILLLLVIFGGLLWKSLPLLQEKSLWELLATPQWRPQKLLFGFWPFIAGTAWVTGIAITWALPVSLLTALFLSEHSPSVTKKIVFPALDILSGIPSVVYGVWGILVVIPFISEKLAPRFVEFSTGYSTLAGGIVLGIMVLPLLISLFTELFGSVPKELRAASLSLGATRWQTTKKVVLRKTFPGILAAVILAISRALGETIAVLMVCGNVAKAPNSLFDASYPLPALIANNYGEMMSVPLYESALMLAALMLFVVVFLFNLLSRIVLYRIEKQIS